jgi:hypothetical protein
LRQRESVWSAAVTVNRALCVPRDAWRLFSVAASAARRPTAAHPQTATQGMAADPNQHVRHRQHNATQESMIATPRGLGALTRRPSMALAVLIRASPAPGAFFFTKAALPCTRSNHDEEAQVRRRACRGHRWHLLLPVARSQPTASPTRPADAPLPR